MFDSRIISCKDVRAWQGFLDRLDPRHRDPHYLPQYLQLFESLPDGECKAYFGGEGLLFVYGNNQNFILYPFFKRPASALQSRNGLASPQYDIISPYGYGGPLILSEDDSSEILWKKFLSEFHGYCKDNNVVSEFCRLHPIFENHIPVSNFSDGEIERLGRIVYINLNLSEEEIISRMHLSRQQNIRKAKKNGCVFHVDADEASVERFFDLYIATMKRRDAKPYYFFPLDFFDKAFKNLDGSIALAYVQYEHSMIAGCIILIFGEIAYYWLAASTVEHQRMRPNDFLVAEATLYAKSRGAKCFVLGGGNAVKEDSLFFYKSRFSKLTKDFFVYRRTHVD